MILHAKVYRWDQNGKVLEIEFYLGFDENG